MVAVECLTNRSPDVQRTGARVQQGDPDKDVEVLTLFEIAKLIAP